MSCRVGTGRVRGANGDGEVKETRRVGELGGCLGVGGGTHPRGCGMRAGSHHILLDLAVRHRDAQRSLSWGEGEAEVRGPQAQDHVHP